MNLKMSFDDLVAKEREIGVFGPFHRAKFLARAPESVKRYLELSKKFPWNGIYDTRQGFAGLDSNDPNPAAFTPITATGDTILWQLPGTWTAIPANDMRAGKVYICHFGGIYTTTTGSNTQVFTPRIGTTTAGTSLGPSATTTLTASMTAGPFYGEFMVLVRSIGVAASGATLYGNGKAAFGGPAGGTAAAIVLTMGGLTTATTIDSTVAQAFVISENWGQGSNSITCEYAFIRSLN